MPCPTLPPGCWVLGQNQPDSNLDSQNSGQFGFRSGSSQVNSNGAVSPSFPTAPYEGVDLVNNGTGLNIAYQGIPSSRSTSTVLLSSLPFGFNKFPVALSYTQVSLAPAKAALGSDEGVVHMVNCPFDLLLIFFRCTKSLTVFWMWVRLTYIYHLIYAVFCQISFFAIYALLR